MKLQIEVEPKWTQSKHTVEVDEVAEATKLKSQRKVKRCEELFSVSPSAEGAEGISRYDAAIDFLKVWSHDTAQCLTLPCPMRPVALRNIGQHWATLGNGNVGTAA